MSGESCGGEEWRVVVLLCSGFGVLVGIVECVIGGGEERLLRDCISIIKTCMDVRYLVLCFSSWLLRYSRPRFCWLMFWGFCW